MYIESVPNRNSPPAVLLRESFRDAGKVRKRTLANLSKWPPTLIEGLRVLLKGGAAVARLEEAFDIVRSKPHGHVAAVLGTLRKLRLDRTIAGADSPERRRVLAMIVARILDPGSKLATARSLAEASARDSLAETLALGEIDEHDLYGAMDWLIERQDAIERRLARRHLKNGALVFYDLTSVYLEGRRCPLGRRGLLARRQARQVADRVRAVVRRRGPSGGGGGVRRQHRGSGHRGRADRQAQAPLRVLQGGVGGRPRDVDRGAHRRGREAGGAGLD